MTAHRRRTSAEPSVKAFLNAERKISSGSRFSQTTRESGSLVLGIASLCVLCYNQLNRKNEGESEVCRVSVIVPVYQVEQYLAKCLDSILAQTFTDFELILVNDGTRDRCPEIMDEYAARDTRIRLVHKENGRLSSARNAGLDIARGEYIVFVDSDDTVEPTMIADAVQAAEKAHADLVIYNYRLVTEKGVQGAYLPMKDEVIDLDALGLDNYFYRYWMPYVHGQEAWCRLYKGNHRAKPPALRANDEVFAEDTLFSAMYLMHVHTIAALAKPYVNYLQRGDSLMGMRKTKTLCAAHQPEHSSDAVRFRNAGGKRAEICSARTLL